MTEIVTSCMSPTTVAADVLVLGARTGVDDVPVLLTEGLTTASHDADGTGLGSLPGLLASLGFTAATDEVIRLPMPAPMRAQAATLLVVGTGKGTPDAADAPGVVGTSDTALRRAAGRATRALAGVDHAVLALPADTQERLTAVTEGALLGAYTWSRLVPPRKAPLARVTVTTTLAPARVGRLHRRRPEDPTAAVLERSRALAEAVATTRDLVNDPPSLLTPEVFAQVALELAGHAGVPAEVRDETQLAVEGFGGIVGVGQGSVHAPRLVRLDWNPSAASVSPTLGGRSLTHVALVGKGITFDSGGLSLKPPASMPAMKSDMAGAATVLAVVLAAARLRLPVRVTGWLALAENLPGGRAQRPGDVVTMYDGTTVEITNTDAEGRLVMADALAVAVAEHPDTVLDVATLTGAQIVALGERTAGVMGTPVVRDAVVAAADRAGEAFWPMPLPDHLRTGLDTPCARIRNAAVGDRAGGMLVAGLFLQEFVGDTPWAHLDVAGPAYNDKAAWGFTPRGGTGAGVSTLLAFLEATTSGSV